MDIVGASSQPKTVDLNIKLVNIYKVPITMSVSLT